KEAREAMAAGPVDCVLLDIRLKDGDGLSFLAELRAGRQRDVPVVVTTAYGDSERTIRAMRDGAFDYLTKPFDLDALLATVVRALEQRSMAEKLAPLPTSRPEEGTLIGSSAAML